jgi:hypothetical protein
MVCLLIFFSLKGIFGFCTEKKNEKVVNTCLARVNRSAAFWRRGQLASAVITVISLHYFIHLNILFLYRCRVYGGSAWFGLKLFFFLSFILFLLFLSRITCWPCKSSYQPFHLFFLLIQPLFSYLQLFYLHWLFLIRFYFQFHPWSFDFF